MKPQFPLSSRGRWAQLYSGSPRCKPALWHHLGEDSDNCLLFRVVTSEPQVWDPGDSHALERGEPQVDGSSLQSQTSVKTKVFFQPPPCPSHQRPVLLILLLTQGQVCLNPNRLHMGNHPLAFCFPSLPVFTQTPPGTVVGGRGTPHRLRLKDIQKPLKRC